MVQREVADRFFAVSENEGLRRGVGARPARRRADRASRGLARGVPPTAERRVGTRRVPPHRARASTRPSSDSSRHRSRTGARRSRTRSRSPASRAAIVPQRRSTRSIGAPAPAPRSSSRPSSSPSQPRSHDQRRGPGEDQPRPRGRRHAARRAARGRDDPSADRPLRHGLARAGRRALGRRLRRRHDRPSRPRGGRGRERASSPTGAPGSRSGSRWRPGSVGAAATRRPRSSWRASSSPRPPTSPTSRRSRRRLGVDVPFFLEAGPQLGTGDGNDARAARPATGLRGAARDAARRQQALDRRDLHALRPRATGFDGSPSARARGRARRPCRRSRRRSRRTTSRARRWLPSCARSGRSGPTSAAPGRSCTACSAIGPPPSVRRGEVSELGEHLAHGPCVVAFFLRWLQMQLACSTSPDSQPGRYLREHKLRLVALDRRDRGDARAPRRDPASRGLRARDRGDRLVRRRWAASTPPRPPATSPGSSLRRRRSPSLIPALLPDRQVARVRGDRRRRDRGLVLLFAERDKL